VRSVLKQDEVSTWSLLLFVSAVLVAL